MPTRNSFPPVSLKTLFPDTNGALQLHRPKGCADCRGTGYSGRKGIYELLEVNERLRYMSQTDALTGLDNRRHLNERIDEMFAHAKRLDEPFSLVMADLARAAAHAAKGRRAVWVAPDEAE